MTEAAKLKVQASDKGGDALAARCEIWACGGHFLVEGTSNGLVGLTLVDGSPRPLSTGTYQVSFRSRANRSQRTRADELLEQAVHELANYLAGRQKIFTVPLCLEHVASPFYRRVLAACSDILYGTAVSYSDLARAANLAP
ncbi:MAG: methylated-DNA--[protein]-cysteine S-methyltransferase, partial [Armatimonadetes bacterium]|nr:methylated-DNA--[protein]-cysteine S-methyltransferase [Armatimonadota bacterium]